MKFVFILILLCFCTCTIVQARSKVQVMTGQGYKVSVKKMVCSNSTALALIDLCRFRLMRGKMGQLSYGVTILKQQKNLWIQFKMHQKSSANIYQPTVIDATYNICDITQSEMAMSPLRTLLTMFLPQAMEILKSFLHRCPYEGRHEIVNFTIDSMTIPNFVPTGDAKLIGTVLGEAKQLLFGAEIYVYFKTPSLMQIN